MQIRARPSELSDEPIRVQSQQLSLVALREGDFLRWQDGGATPHAGRPVGPPKHNVGNVQNSTNFGAPFFGQKFVDFVHNL